MAPVAEIDDNILSGLLQAGGWSETADDCGGNERLAETFVATLVRDHSANPDFPPQSALIGLGVLVLALSVAEWGVAWGPAAPDDPARQNWRGPADIRAGKHLMSYALGGIGLPHLDGAAAVKFYKALVEQVPAAKDHLQRIGALSNSFRYDPIRASGGPCAAKPANAVLMEDLDGNQFQHAFPVWGGTSYCMKFNPERRLDSKAWQILRHWSRVGLRRRDMQAWIVRDWLNSFWVPAYNQVMLRPHGTAMEALVVARMRSSAPGDALSALSAAGSEPDPRKRIAAELARYAAGSETHRDRIGVMQRPGAAYEFISKIS